MGAKAVVVYTKRNREIIRIISARKANKREQKIYEQKEGSF
ncbi:MAG: BrnT family toxin [Gomphosphaeria aponina SAG 52.96 = DSM 107014]|uniref:BrnT family toxin n=1 Tax=Gomphosphaeria aponina SAG 52.96 = DSM 107014 TaxID=1521640 RepID=A0A941GX41_9CHRO|nr:BrnT family toxin [Gomphosphaeria aponina SAG 52.96 = DSM 107014]